MGVPGSAGCLRDKPFFVSSATIKVDRRVNRSIGALPALDSVLLELGRGADKAGVFGEATWYRR